jgi:hypothetical protein
MCYTYLGWAEGEKMLGLASGKENERRRKGISSACWVRTSNIIS